MIVKTEGIVIGFIRYRETSVIVKIFTEALGLKSYIVNGVRGGKSGRQKIALYQPFTILDLAVYNGSRSALQRISEARNAMPLYSATTKIGKLTQLLFAAEVLGKTLKEDDPNPELFARLVRLAQILDAAEDGFPGFHLVFLLELSRFFGFCPASAAELAHLTQSENSEYFAPEYLAPLQTLMDFSADRPELPPAFSAPIRRALLDSLLHWFSARSEKKLHIKSVGVLREL